VTDDALDRIHHALEAEIARGERRLQKAEQEGNRETYEWLVDDECDQVEELLGIAFVAAQPFVNRIRTHLVSINSACQEDFQGRQLSFFGSGRKTSDLLKRGDSVPGKAISLVEAIYAVGNFWKHSDEWPRCEQKTDKHIGQVWDRTRMKDVQKTTFDVIMTLGLVLGSTGNLRTAAKAIGIKKYSDLAPIRQALLAWTQEIFETATKELEAFTAAHPTNLPD
jgi:hypothetical protein